MAEHKKRKERKSFNFNTSNKNESSSIKWICNGYMKFVNHSGSTVINQGNIIDSTLVEKSKRHKNMSSHGVSIRLVNGKLPTYEFLMNVWKMIGDVIDIDKVIDDEDIQITNNAINTAISTDKNSTAVAGGVASSSIILNVGDKIKKKVDKKKEKKNVKSIPTEIEGVEEEDFSSEEIKEPVEEEKSEVKENEDENSEVDENDEDENSEVDENDENSEVGESDEEENSEMEESDEVENDEDDESNKDSPYSNPTFLEIAEQTSREIDSKGWKKFFSYLLKKKKKCIDSISTALEEDAKKGVEIYPPPEEIFTAMELCPLEETKVLIIGQDPYHTPGAAMGVAFSVKEDQPIPPSLNNIFKELKKDGFSFIPGNGDLSDWAVQGVLMLNTAFTVQKGSANSYSKEWSTFTKYLINYINKKVENLVVVMWGKNAQSYKEYFDESRHKFIESAHPSPLSASKGFFGSKPFSKINKYLKKLGHDEIDWNL